MWGQPPRITQDITSRNAGPNIVTGYFQAEPGDVIRVKVKCNWQAPYPCLAYAPFYSQGSYPNLEGEADFVRFTFKSREYRSDGTQIETYQVVVKPLKECHDPYLYLDHCIEVVAPGEKIGNNVSYRMGVKALRY